MYIWTLLIRLVAENPYTAGAITPIQPVAEPDRIPRTILACLRSFAISKLSREATIPMSISLFLALVSLVGWFLHKNMREEKFRRLYRWVLTWVMIGFGVYFLCIVYSYVRVIRERFGLSSLKFNTLETLVEAIGLPKCKLCTHCFDGSSHF